MLCLEGVVSLTFPQIQIASDSLAPDALFSRDSSTRCQIVSKFWDYPRESTQIHIQVRAIKPRPLPILLDNHVLTLIYS
jgi:hypothetical protein